MKTKNPCDCCAYFLLNPDHFSRYNPACLHCGARYIKQMPRWAKGAEEVAERRRRVLKTWMEYGHKEEDLRSLAKGAAFPTASIGPVESSGSVSRSQGRRRSVKRR
jgi:hypothetical protein